MPPEGLPRRVFLLPSLLLVMATTSTSSADATRGASPSEEGESGRGPFSPILNWLSQSQRSTSARKGSSPTTAGGSTGTLAFAAPPSSPPTHLTVLVHGYVGTPKDLTYLKESIERIGKGTTQVHMARSNDGLTRDGVRKGGARLAEEVREVVGQNPSLKRISIVGNSLGGLYARYAISMLYEAKDKTIAGLEPQTFMTIASPHLGVRKYLGFPVPDPLHFLAPVFVGKSGADLFLRDHKEEEQKRRDERVPLLLRMATEPQFLEPLAAFKHRRAYANVQRDLLVPLGTAAFNLPTLKIVPVKALRYPEQELTMDIIRVPPLSALQSVSGDATGTTAAPRLLSTSASLYSGEASPSSSPFADALGEAWMEDYMAERLNTLGWSKVLVEFRDVIPNAHNMICALSRDRLTSFVYKRGRPVMDHAARFLVDPEREEDEVAAEEELAAA